MQAEQFLEYTVVDLDTLSKSQAKDVLTQAQNTPYEIRGEVDSTLVVAFFLRLRSIASEIIYRPNGSEVSYLILTHEDEAKIIRPSTVKRLVEFSDAEMEKLSEKQGLDQATEIKIDLTEWAKLGDQGFLTQLYTVQPNKTKVELQGEAPLVLILTAINWFSPHVKEFVYNNQLISNS